MASVHTPSQPRIAIVGGGPAGLVLLLSLHRRGIPATLYEREASASSRAHMGGTLDLGWDNGQRALRENGLEEMFNQNSRPEGDEIRFSDSTGEIRMTRKGNASNDPTKIRPEIDRTVLRRIILDAVPVDSIKWGHSLQSAEPIEGGQHKLTFSNGVTVVCNILVGADGAHSCIRPLVSPAVPFYVGINGAEVSLTPEVVASPELADIRELVGEGQLFCPENNRLLSAQKNSSGRIRTYLWFRGPEDWRVPSEPKEAKKALLEIYPGWNSVLLKLIEHCDEGAIYRRPLYTLPVDHKWTHVPGVTLIGDAAHLMLPAGSGANVSMLDGLELGIVLSEAISKGLTDEEREAAIQAREEKMFASAGKLSSSAYEGLQRIVHPDAPRSLMDMAKKFIKEGHIDSTHGVAN